MESTTQVDTIKFGGFFIYFKGSQVIDQSLRLFALPNSEDPAEMPCLIWVYTVCHVSIYKFLVNKWFVNIHKNVFYCTI